MNGWRTRMTVHSFISFSITCDMGFVLCEFTSLIITVHNSAIALADVYRTHAFSAQMGSPSGDVMLDTQHRTRRECAECFIDRLLIDPADDVVHGTSPIHVHIVPYTIVSQSLPSWIDQQPCVLG